jgi:hypothetical protein
LFHSVADLDIAHWLHRIFAYSNLAQFTLARIVDASDWRTRPVDPEPEKLGAPARMRTASLESLQSAKPGGLLRQEPDNSYKTAM